MARRQERIIVTQPNGYNNRPNSGYLADSSDGSRRGTGKDSPMELGHVIVKRADEDDGNVAGMSDLEKTDALVVQQQMAVDLKGGCGVGNTYQMKSKEGSKLFFAAEEDNCCCRWLCGPHRMFHLTIFNKNESPVLFLDREACRCDWWCCADCCCCQHKLIVRDVSGEPIGVIREKFHCFNFNGDVMDRDGNVMYKLKGPCCACRCCSEMNFDIFDSKGEHEVGFFYKKWLGIKEWVNVDHENYEVQFPEDASVFQKTMLMAASFLVDFMYFEMS